MATIQTKGLTYRYGIGTPFEKTAVDHVDLEIESGSFVGIIGHTGSGKSTLIQHLNGLLKPTEGSILLDGKDIWAEKAQMRQVRFRVGLVFQYPEHQLFAETVYKDVAFGPRNLGLSGKEVDALVRSSLERVGLSFDELAEKSPFELSGGQQRRVAFAGVLAMDPQVLVLDEPAAGLDPASKRSFLEMISRLHDQGLTVVMVSHCMDDLAAMCDRVAVMSAGHILQLGTPEDIYNEPQSAFVADFIGDSDIMAGTMVRDKLVRFLGCDFPCVDTGFGENADVDVVLRPEDVKLKPADDPVQGVPQGVVESLLFKGVHYEMKVRVGDNVLLVHSTHARPVGTQVKLTVAPEDIQVMRKSDYSPDILKRHAARV